MGVQGAGEMEVVEAGEQGRSGGEEPHDEAGSDVPAIVAKSWCGSYAVASAEFTADNVGAKSLNTSQLKASLH